MKLNKGKNKGKIHPSPSSSSSLFSPTSTTTNSSIDPVSNLNNLLPTAILTLISILSLQDKEVLAYMITHNKKVTTFTTNNGKKSTTTTHKIPSFDCGCFDCYTSYWVRWDSSPNQELIHQAIDAFEEHHGNFEQSKKVTPKSSRKNNNKLKKLQQSSSLFTTPVTKNEVKVDSPEILEVGSSGNEGIESPVKVDDVAVEESKKIVNHNHQPQQQLQHKGFARKVLPDVIGLFNYRLWNLWGPN